MPLLSTKITLLPAMEGTLTFKGAPAANANVKMHVFWKDDVGEKKSSTRMTLETLVFRLRDEGFAFLSSLSSLLLSKLP